MGRATRLCFNLYGEDQHKEYFRVFDAVNIYATLQKYRRCGRGRLTDNHISGPRWFPENGD